jgi:hypothetical protein
MLARRRFDLCGVGAGSAPRWPQGRCFLEVDA